MRATVEAEVWGRMLSPNFEGMTPSAARALLSLKFTKSDVERVDELRRLAVSGHLTPADRDELEVALHLNDLVVLLQAKARGVLDRQPARKRRQLA